MPIKTFNHGYYLSHCKELSQNLPITTIPLPREVVIPLHQHTGAPCHPLVKAGDPVQTGQKIGDSSAYVSAVVHSSVNGTVTAVEPRPYFTGTNVESVVIAVDPEQKEPAWPEQDLTRLPKDAVKAAIREAGIVGMGGAAFPTHVKLNPPKLIDAVIINACECEPYLTCDHRLLVEETTALIEGARIIRKLVGAPKVYFGIETNKPDGLAAVKAAIDGDRIMEVVALEVKYPQGSEKQLIKAIMNREVPPGMLPFDAGVVVHNVSTAIAIYEACRYQKPLYERVLTVSGDGVVRPGNIRVRIGTPIGHIIEQCGGFRSASIAKTALDKSEVRYPVFAPPRHLVGKIIMGGPMTGWAQSKLDVPVVKGTNGILIFTPRMVAETEYKACVRCAKCVDHCPMYLYPNYIGKYAETGQYEKAVDWGALDCFECGICVYVCPSNRPIVQFVRQTKKQRKK
jgi:electron transport complex protein RnfC